MKKIFLKKGALEISFGWLFAIIIGGVVIFSAIFLSSKITDSSDEIVSAEIGKEINILLNPLETSFETAQTTSIVLTTETRINNLCSDGTPFGKQSLRIDQKRLNEWTNTDIKTNSYSKYIFSKDQIEGKKFYIFSKPFNFPFKVADLIYLTSAEEFYCFKNAPDSVKKEISELDQENLILENCTDEHIKICFSGNNCDVNVKYREGYLEKDNEKIYFENVGESDALMYGAIFADKDIYECQVKRLMMRLEELCYIYYNKEIANNKVGCEGSVSTELIQLKVLAGNFENSSGIKSIGLVAEDVEKKNRIGRCSLW
jgi:hypothetical protein